MWTMVLVVLGMGAPLCPTCSQASALFARGDTAAALEMARRAAGERPEDARAVGLLGELLVRTAPTRATDFTERAEAEELLRQAIDLDGDNPRWWYALGLLERKRLGKLDAIRFFRRSEKLAREGKGKLDDSEHARLLTEIARALEEHVLDFQGFIAQNNAIPIVQGSQTEVCPVAFCRNFERPLSFHEILFSFEPQDQLVKEDREMMREAFGEAFLMDPSSERAARGWLGELARSREWEAFTEVARRHTEAAEDKGWPMVFLGAGLWRLGRPEDADMLFEQALKRLPEDERMLLRDVTRLLRKDVAEVHEKRSEAQREAFRDLYWTTVDPLFSTEPNERLLEHYTRVALAELWFDEPQLKTRGSETDRGLVLIRYGEPRSIRQTRMDSGEAQAFADLVGGVRLAGAGRWIFWTYARDMPSFIFFKQIGTRSVDHAITTNSKELEEIFRERKPSAFALPGFDTLAHQLARFKGTEADVEADVILAIPSVDGERTEVEAAGAFAIIPTEAGRRPVKLDTKLDLAVDGGRTATFRVPVNRGRFPYSVEVVSEDRSILRASRGELDALSFGVGSFFLSDLLLARSIRPARPEPAERRHFAIAPAADQRYRVGEPVAIYFEIYGLDAREEAAAGYAVEVRVTGGEDGGFFRGVVRRLSDLLGSEEESGVVRWEGSVRGSPERVPEWFSLTLPELEPGEYQIEVRVRDRIRDREAVTSRHFTLVGASP